MNDNKLVLFAVVMMMSTSMIVAKFSPGIVKGVETTLEKPSITSAWTVLWKFLTFQVTTDVILISVFFWFLTFIIIYVAAKMIRGTAS